MTKGECNCGAIAFEVDQTPSNVFVCHCSICRKYSGSNGIAVVIVDKTVFRWLYGEDMISSWKKPDADWGSWFCKCCGSALPGENDLDSMFIPAGLISSDGLSMHVAHHIFVGSKAEWDEIGDDGKQHIAQFMNNSGE